MQTIKHNTLQADIFDPQPNGVQHALVWAEGVEVARISRRTFTGWSIWINEGARRGIVRDLRGDVVYFDSVEEALWPLEHIL